MTTRQQAVAAATHVLVFTPPRMYEKIRDRVTKPGSWELVTMADFNDGTSAPDAWAMETGRDTPVAALKAWAGALLRYPVTLTKGSAQVGRRSEPLYWVQREETP